MIRPLKAPLRSYAYHLSRLPRCLFIHHTRDLTLHILAFRLLRRFALSDPLSSLTSHVCLSFTLSASVSKEL